jgi:hypothetical protein
MQVMPQIVGVNYSPVIYPLLMPELNANIPPIEAYVRGNYLRDQRDSFNTYFPCVIFGVASVKSRSPLFHFLMEDGGLWWRMPISAFCTEPDVPEVDLHDLVLWNSFSPYVSVTRFESLYNMRIHYMDRHKQRVKGKYLFTLDWHAAESNIVDTGFSEVPGQHKCGHVIQRDDGNSAIQPNNRVLLLDPSFTTKKNLVIDRLLNTHKYDVEDADKWITEDSDRYNYEVSQR